MQKISKILPLVVLLLTACRTAVSSHPTPNNTFENLTFECKHEVRPSLSVARFGHLFYLSTYYVNRGNRHSYKAVGFPATGADALRVYIQRLGFPACCLVSGVEADWKRPPHYNR